MFLFSEATENTCNAHKNLNFFWDSLTGKVLLCPLCVIRSVLWRFLLYLSLLHSSRYLKWLTLFLMTSFKAVKQTQLDLSLCFSLTVSLSVEDALCFVVFLDVLGLWWTLQSFPLTVFLSSPLFSPFSNCPLLVSDAGCHGLWASVGLFCQSGHLWIFFRS